MASKGASALTGAGTGAAAGTAIMPGIGTVAGAAIGGVAGYLLGDDEEKVPTYTPNAQNFQYGLGSSGSYASLESERYNRAQAGLASVGADAYHRDAPTQSMPTRINQVQSEGQSYLEGADAAGRTAQLGALEGLQGRVSALDRFANTPQGPSAAQAQLQAGTDAAAKQQYGFARSQAGGGGAALRNAAFNAAGISGNAANTAATIKAKETADYENRRLAALDAALGGAGTATGYAGQLRGMDQGFAQTQAGQANYDAGAANQFNQGQQNLEYQVGANNLQAAGQARGQNDSMYLGTVGASQQYDAMRNQNAQANTNAGIALEGARAEGAGVATTNRQITNNQNNAELAMGLNAAGSGLAAYQASQSAQPQAPSQPKFDRSTAEFDSSDERLKEIEGRERALSAALETVGNAPAYSYKYKNPNAPGAKPGRMVGPMAQDLERGPLGDTIVEDTPNGKMVDTGRLEMVNSSAITELDRKVKALEAALGRAA